jgi:UTP:GlnB (protein PII) uridylyltransferase
MDTFEVQHDSRRVDDDSAAAAIWPDAALRHSQPKHVSLRHVLRALASEQESVAAPHNAIGRLRPIVQAERNRARNRAELGAAPHVVPTQWSGFVDGAVIGLCHFARVCCDRSARTMVAPLAVIAAGRLGRSELCPHDPLDLIFLSPNDKPARMRAKRITTFARQALIDLGFVVDHLAVSSGRSAQIVNATIAATSAPCELRFLWGHFALYSRFTEMLERAP